MKKTILALTAAAVTTMGTVGAFAQYPGYADLDRDGVVTAAEYRKYASRRSDENGNHAIDPGEQSRFDRLMNIANGA